MIIELTLSDKGTDTDIVTYIFNQSNGGAIRKLHDWLDSKEFETSVFVCFENNRGLKNEYLRNEQRSFLVSHSWDDITDFCESILSEETNYNVDFAVFEFEDYQDAFGYCTDLKESF